MRDVCRSIGVYRWSPTAAPPVMCFNIASVWLLASGHRTNTQLRGREDGARLHVGERIKRI